MSKRPALLVIVAICGVAAGSACRKGKPDAAVPAAAAPAQDPRITKIWLTKDGVIELDGKVVDMGAVEAALAAVAEKKGVVFYGRDAARESPHPTGAKIIEMIVARGLPVRLSSKPDFSDAVGPGQ